VCILSPAFSQNKNQEQGPLETFLTRRVDGIHGGHRQARLNGAQGGDGVFGEIRQTDGQNIGLVELKLGLQTDGKGSAGISHLGESILTIGDHTNLKRRY